MPKSFLSFPPRFLRTFPILTRAGWYARRVSGQVDFSLLASPLDENIRVKV